MMDRWTDGLSEYTESAVVDVDVDVCWIEG